MIHRRYIAYESSTKPELNLLLTIKQAVTLWKPPKTRFLQLRILVVPFNALLSLTRLYLNIIQSVFHKDVKINYYQETLLLHKPCVYESAPIRQISDCMSHDLKYGIERRSRVSDLFLLLIH